MAKLIPLEHPGTILKEEFIKPLGLSNYKVAKATGISEVTIGRIVKGSQPITPNSGLRLAKFFGLSDDYFVKIQMQYDVDEVKQKEGKKIGKIIRFTPKEEMLLEA